MSRVSTQLSITFTGWQHTGQIPFMLPPVSFQGDQRFKEAAFRQALLERGPEERAPQAIVSVCLTAHFPAPHNRSRLRQVRIIGSRNHLICLHLLSEHRAMLPLNLRPEHYMFLLTKSRQPCTLLVLGNIGTSPGNRPLTYATCNEQGRCMGLLIGADERKS
jgi:hypothetical protein